ncbi:MAG: hypothetical protein LPK27_17680, partial [Rhodococcus sp. (in: high G+C Gram-positive bacteria)]|nr:hypothetical protein [Rhodococcus sp. (in: high G+C Gram-positive bacteria)]
MDALERHAQHLPDVAEGCTACLKRSGRGDLRRGCAGACFLRGVLGRVELTNRGRQVFGQFDLDLDFVDRRSRHDVYKVG